MSDDTDKLKFLLMRFYPKDERLRKSIVNLHVGIEQMKGCRTSVNRTLARIMSEPPERWEAEMLEELTVADGWLSKIDLQILDAANELRIRLRKRDHDRAIAEDRLQEAEWAKMDLKRYMGYLDSISTVGEADNAGPSERRPVIGGVAGTRKAGDSSSGGGSGGSEAGREGGGTGEEKAGEARLVDDDRSPDGQLDSEARRLFSE